MTSTVINYLDIGIIAILFIFILVGIIRGFTSDFLGLFTWVGAFFTTTKLAPYGTYLMRQFIHNNLFADLSAVFLIFIISLIMLVALVKTLANAIHKSMLSGIDRSLGIISGFFRGTVLLTIAYMVALMFWKPGGKPEIIKNSRLEPFLVTNARFVHNYLIPSEFFPKKLTQHLYDKQFQHQEKSAEELVQSLSSPKPQQKTASTQPESKPETPQKNTNPVDTRQTK